MQAYLIHFFIIFVYMARDSPHIWQAGIRSLIIPLMAKESPRLIPDPGRVQMRTYGKPYILYN